ncbi:MAG: RNA polymerase sigma factor [Moorellaceae bacterium]
MWEHLYNIVFRYLLKLGLSCADAEDIAQEALLSTYLHLDSIEEGKLTSYLLTTARNRFIDLLRQKQNTRELVIQPLSDFGIDNLSEMHQLETQEVVQKAVNRLSITEQKLFYMKYHLGLTNAEISSLLNTSPDSVKTMLWRLRKKLRKYLKEGEGS